MLLSLSVDVTMIHVNGIRIKIVKISTKRLEQRTHVAKIFDALLLELAPRAILYIYILAVSHVQPGCIVTVSSNNEEKDKADRGVRKEGIPEEERLAALALEPEIVVNVEVMPISVTRVDLQRLEKIRYRGFV